MISECDNDDYYTLLGVTRDATKTEITKAYRRLSLKWHPDKNPSEEAQEMFVKISSAYTVLNDPGKRQIYDLSGKDGLDENFSLEDAKKMATQIFDEIFIYGYGPRDECKEVPNASHGKTQAWKGGFAAPVTGCGLGGVMLVGGVVFGGASVVGGVVESLGNFVGGTVEIGKACTQRPQKTQYDDDHIPSISHGLKRVTLGVVSAPVKGVFCGLGAILVGVGAAAVSIGAGFRGAYVNIKQGRKEMKEALDLEYKSGIPDQVQYGDKLKAKNLLEQMQKRSIITLEKEETMDFFYCTKVLRAQRKQSDEETDDDEDIMRQEDEVSNCIFLTNHRFGVVKNRKLESYKRKDIRNVELINYRVVLHLATAGHPYSQIGMPNAKLATFFVYQLQSSLMNEENIPPVPVPADVFRAQSLEPILNELKDTKRIKFSEKEQLLYYYRNVRSGVFSAASLLNDLTSKCILLTTDRLIRIDKGNVIASIMIDDIDVMEFVPSASIYKWDRLVFTLVEDATESEAPAYIPLIPSTTSEETRKVCVSISQKSIAMFFHRLLKVLLGYEDAIPTSEAYVMDTGDLDEVPSSSCQFTHCGSPIIPSSHDYFSSPQESSNSQDPSTPNAPYSKHVSRPQNSSNPTTHFSSGWSRPQDSDLCDQLD